MARSTHLEKQVTDALDTRITSLESGTSSINDNAVTNAKLAEMAATTVKANITNASADPSDVTLANFAAELVNDTGTGDGDIWSAEKVANEINLASTSSLTYQGGYDASTNTPDLDTNPSDIKLGYTYTVTTAGQFYTEDIQVGDFLIAEVDDPDSLDDWTIVNSNVGDASTTTKGLVELATGTETDAGLVIQANDPRLSDSRSPSGTAGGDLTGSYPNPTLADDAVTGAKIADSGISLAKIADIGSQTILGNNEGSAAAPAALSVSDIRTLLNVENGAAADQSAAEVPFTPGRTGLTATNLQAAVEELDTTIDGLSSSNHAAVTLDSDANGLTLTGQQLGLDLATITTDGALSSTDKTKLDGIETGATADQDADEVTYTNTTSGLTATDVQAAIDELAEDKHSSKIQRRSVSGPVSFTNTDAKYQHFVVSSAITGTLPATPTSGKHFIIKNSPSSTESITVNSVAVAVGEIYEIIYDGTEWVEY